MNDVDSRKPARSISVVMPAYNEEENIETAVRTARDVLTTYCNSLEIIVVNDGSADRTGEILNLLAGEVPELCVLHHERNRGYGGALRTGFYSASNELVLLCDSDLQFDFNDIDALLPWTDEFHIVAGYRAKRADPAYRRLNAWMWNMMVRIVLGVKVRDLDCAFKLFRREVFDAIQLEADGAMINTELFALARRNYFRVKEVPVRHYPRTAGAQTGAKLRVILNAFRELFRMYHRLGPVPAARLPVTPAGQHTLK